MSLGSQQYFIESSPVYTAVTPSDTVNFDVTSLGRQFLETRALFVGVTGNVVAIRPDGTAITFTGVPAGSVLPIVCIRVNSTSTTATSIVALF